MIKLKWILVWILIQYEQCSYVKRNLDTQRERHIRPVTDTD
jgi:hypothetical protein